MKIELHSPAYNRPVRTFFGYPIHPLADPDRPWWREVTSCDTEGAASYWLRTDGLYTHDMRDLSQLDELKPLERPSARIGQIWMTSEGEPYVCNTKADVERVENLWRKALLPSLVEPRYLVWGPGSPWAGRR